MNLRANMLSQLFPGICLLCRRRSKRGIDLCRECELAFEANQHACPLCAEPTPVSSADGRCGACVAAPPPWAKTVAPFLYTAPLSTLVEGLKSGNGLLQARILGALLADAVQARYADEPLPDALIPVPLTRKRRLQRGFNQAELLANVVGRTLRLPRHLSLARIKNAPPQRTLARAARQRNVRGAFVVRRDLRCRRPAVVDDVTTTGATVRAAAQALLAAGASEVHVWVAAKTPAA